MKKPKATRKHIDIHKAARAALAHLKKLPPGVRKELGALPGKYLDYASKEFHKRVKLPHQKHNLGEWASTAANPVMKC